MTRCPLIVFARLQWDLYGDGEVTKDCPIWDAVRVYNRKRKIVVGRFSKAYEGKSGEITTIGQCQFCKNCRENTDQTTTFKMSAIVSWLKDPSVVGNFKFGSVAIAVAVPME